MTSRTIQSAQVTSNRQRGHELIDAAPGGSPISTVGRAAMDGHMDDGVDLSRGVKRRHGSDNDDATDQLVSEHLKKQRATVTNHLPAHMRLRNTDDTTDAAALEEQQRHQDTDRDGGGGGGGGTSTEITTTALSLGNRAHSHYCRVCMRGNRRDAPKNGPLNEIVEAIKTNYDGKNLDIVTDAVFDFSRAKWPKQQLWTKESIRYHIEYVYTGMASTIEKCLMRVNTVLGLFDRSSLVVVDKATNKEYPNLKVLATYKAYLDTAVNYATRLG